MTLSVHEIAHAFAYGQSFGEIRSINIVRMRVALASGAITVQTEAAQPHHWFNGDDETWRARHRFASQFSGQTDDHRYICANAARWLESEGFKWTARDLNYPGGIADVAVPESQIAVECGYTNAEKVLDGCSRGWTMIVMPYSAEVAAHVFTPARGSCGSIDALFGTRPREDQVRWWQQAFSEMLAWEERERTPSHERPARTPSPPRTHNHERWRVGDRVVDFTRELNHATVTHVSRSGLSARVMFDDPNAAPIGSDGGEVNARAQRTDEWALSGGVRAMLATPEAYPIIRAIVAAENTRMMEMFREMGERGAELLANQPEPIPQAYPRDFTYARTKAWEQDATRFDDVRTIEMIAAFEAAGRVTDKWEPK